MQSTSCPDPTDLTVFRIRRAQATDLAELMLLERQCFHPDLQESVTSIQYSLKSQHQEVWIAEQDGIVLGALFLRTYKNSLRVYSIAVVCEAQGKGIGSELLRWAVDRATRLGKRNMILEVDDRDTDLIRWYESNGFMKRRLLPRYYSESRDAWKMIRPVGINRN